MARQKRFVIYDPKSNTYLTGYKYAEYKGGKSIYHARFSDIVDGALVSTKQTAARHIRVFEKYIVIDPNTGHQYDYQFFQLKPARSIAVLE